MFTSAIVFQLIEEKKLTLKTKLSKFYPEIKKADSITIGDLLSHKSGIYNYTNDSIFIDYCKLPQTKAAMLKRLAGYESDFKPGSKADYSNSNYLLLGYIIEDITKKPYKANVNDRIIKPLGLKNTYYYSKLNPKRKEAYSYEWKNKKWSKIEEWDQSVAFAAGALLSTPTDLTKFIKALFDGKVIKKESLDQMTKIEFGYGYGIFSFPFGERKFYGHTGGIEGFSSNLGYHPKEELSISLIQNGDNYETNDIMIGVLSIYYKLPYSFPNLVTADVNPDILKSYEGTYTTPALPFKVNIKLIDGKLMAQATGQGQFPLTAVSETEFIFDPAGVAITFSKTGFTLNQGGTKTEFVKE
jgi:CubicO group peptidase (beta-lactamase class C family)